MTRWRRLTRRQEPVCTGKLWPRPVGVELRVWCSAAVVLPGGASCGSDGRQHQCSKQLPDGRYSGIHDPAMQQHFRHLAVCDSLFVITVVTRDGPEVTSADVSCFVVQV